jgi:glycosyltransferase involved in cell wall biosynthesis
MRIYMVMSVLAPLGGIEAALLPLAKEIKSQGHEILVYAIWPPPLPNQNVEALEQFDIPIITSSGRLATFAKWGAARRPRLIDWLSIPVIPLLFLVAGLDSLVRQRAWRRSFQGVLGAWRGWLFRKLDFESLYYLRLSREFRVKAPDVVHVHGWGCGEDPPGAVEWLHRQNLSVVYTEHNSPDPALHSPIENAPMNFAQVLIAVSRAGAAGLRAVGQARRPIVVIPYSLEGIQSLPLQPGRGFTIACIARLAIQKGHSYLIDAMAQVVQVIPGATLLLAGDGPLRSEIESQIRQLGLSEAVKFTGTVTRADLTKLYAQIDVIVLPSLWEGLPVSLMEAMSAGKPIVATNVGGNPELVVHGLNGLIVPERDSKALAQALILLGKDANLRAQMAQASREQFKQGEYDPSSVANKTVAAYRTSQEEFALE